MPQRPIAFAHRGGMAHRRENTLDAFRNAVAMGATAVETDAYITRDGVVVFDHDGVVVIDGVTRAIADVDRVDLPGHIPTMAEFYAACGVDLDLSIDVRDPRAAAAIVALAVDAGDPAASRLWLCAETVEELEQWRELSPVVHLVHSTELSTIGIMPFSHLQRMARAGIEVLNLHESEINPLLVVACHSAGVKIFGWNAHDEHRAARLVRFGVDAIYGNDIPAMQRAIDGPDRRLA